MDTRTRPSRRYSGKNKNSRGLAVAKDIGPQLISSNAVVCDVLEGRPILSGDQGAFSKPFGDRLLAKRRPPHVFGYAVRKRGLATSDLNGLLQSSNVRFLHDHPDYTTSVVLVNNKSGVPIESGTCTVLSMPAVQRKQRSLEPDVEAARGPDGFTLGERLKACMEAKGRRLGKTYRQKHLLTDANKAAGRTDEYPVITQQGLSLILNNKRFDSGATAAFAVALEVEALWLAFGVGPKSYLDAALKKSG